MSTQFPHEENDNEFSLDDFSLELDGEEEDGEVFTGFDDTNISDLSEFDIQSFNDEEDDSGDNNVNTNIGTDNEDDFSLDLGNEFVLDDVFIELEENNDSLDDEDEDEDIENNDVDTANIDNNVNTDVDLSQYQETVGDKPEREQARKEPKIRERQKPAREITPEDYRAIYTQETVKGIDLIDINAVHKDLQGTHKNKATKGRSYDRKDKGILSDSQVRYFTSLSTTNLSNARYPDEYMNLVRSNEELLDHSERVHKKAISGFVSKGLNDKARENIAEHVHVSVSAGDEEILTVLAQLKYASTKQIARATARSYNKTREALKGMKDRKLVKNPDSPYYDQKLWCVTDLGMIFSGLDLSIPDLSGISVAMLQHTTVANNVAAYIHSGSVNVLDDDIFPRVGRLNKSKNPVHGEKFVSETQMRSALGKLTSEYSISGTKGDIYIPLIKGDIDDKFSRWERLKKKDENLPSPEMELGNEHMWVLMPPARIGILQHIPDLVIPRKRNPDGSPESIAIEVELKSKSLEDYIRTHKAYSHDKRMFKKVIWICNKKATAALITKAAEQQYDLWNDNRIEILPVITENGVFKGRNVLAMG